MALTYHKSVSASGGAKSTEISSGSVNALFPEITASDQVDGATISRKFYIANDGAEDVVLSAFSLDDYAVFVAILFESSGDAQVVGDLTGSETDESPISVTIPASGHKSFWIQIDVPIGSTETDSFWSADVKTTKG